MADATSAIIYAVGDVALQRPDPGTAFAKVAAVLNQADLVFGNLESPISDRREVGEGKSPALVSRTDTLPAIAAAGFDVLSLANNHIMDFRRGALEDTIRLLDEAGIAHVGAGMSLSEAREPVFVDCKGTRLAFLAYNSIMGGMWTTTGATDFPVRPGAVPIFIHAELEPGNVYEPHLEEMRADIAKVRSQADLVFVSHHYGVPCIHTVVAHQKTISRATIDAGADMVLGHHPHILQGIEVYKGKVICYSLSEFCLELPLPRILNPQTILLKVEIGAKKIRKVSFLPVLMDPERTPEIKSLEDPDGMAIAKLMEGLCRQLGLELAYEGDELVVLKE